MIIDQSPSGEIFCVIIHICIKICHIVYLCVEVHGDMKKKKWLTVAFIAFRCYWIIEIPTNSFEARQIDPCLKFI